VHRRNGFLEVLAVGEFRALWSAEIVSVCGDQLARVGLSVLVFQRTSSTALTALTYALTFVPALVGGALLSGLADRLPRRAVLIGTDVARAGLAGLMAVPGLPLPVLWTLVFGLAMAGAPFKAAQLALLPEVLAGERYPVGLSLRTVSAQVAQLAGFVLGGSVLLVVSAPTALGVNAPTFVFSAVIVHLGVRARPPAAGPDGVAAAEPSPTGAELARSQLIALIGLVWLAGLTVAPEGWPHRTPQVWAARHSRSGCSSPPIPWAAR
jgi:MFS family permease